MLVSSLLNASLRKIGGLSSSETPETARSAEALEALQSMLRSWSSLRINVFASVKESFNLVSGTASYSWGSGGVIATARPNNLLGVYVRDSSGVDHPVEIVSEGRYRSVTSKTLSGRPTYTFLHPLYPLAYLYVYPVPDAIEAMWLDSLKPFTEASSFSAITDIIAFPVNYEEAIIYNLAIRLAPEYGKTVSAEVALIASKSFSNLITLNAASQVEPVSITVPGDSLYGDGYSINTDSY